MGTHFFKSGAVGAPKIGNVPGSNLFARAISAPGYAARSFGGAATKDTGMAQAVYKAGGLKPTARDAAFAPGPKRT